MWIIDTCHRGCVDLWEAGSGRCISEPYFPPFYLHLPDPHLHREMLEALESRYRAEECSFRTVYGSIDGYRIYAGRAVAEALELQTGFSAELYNVDIRLDQRYLAERGMFPCGHRDESRFDPDLDADLKVLDLEVIGDPRRDREVRAMNVAGKRLEGSEAKVLSDMFSLIEAHGPDVILFPYGDSWTGLILARARRHGLEETISRSGRFRSLGARSYWSYGRACRRVGAKIPDGRVLIDTRASFAYKEAGLRGILMASRLSGLSPNLAARFTPGTLISSYEVYQAVSNGLAVPFRKRDPEGLRSFAELKARDKGGMIFQPEPGVYEDVHQLDFASLYPSIIVNYNLSPETLGRKGHGFLPCAIRPLLSLRLKTKRLKKSDAGYAGLDSILKWMLVTCFGYTGYRNARFGSIEVHEKITEISRELLIQSKEIAESMGFGVLHGIVDCLWVRGGSVPVLDLKERIEEATGIATELESYDWIAFLPMKDGRGAYNRYFGRLSDGRMKIRGIAARRGDTPEYIRNMQKEVLAAMGRARSAVELCHLEADARRIWERYATGLKSASARDMVIRRRISRVDYSRKCAEASAVGALKRSGIDPAPGMEVGYVITDASDWEVEEEDSADDFDIGHYGKMLDAAFSEVAFAFRSVDKFYLLEN